jgi:hypothetical protein
MRKTTSRIEICSANAASRELTMRQRLHVDKYCSGCGSPSLDEAGFSWQETTIIHDQEHVEIMVNFAAVVIWSSICPIE